METLTTKCDACNGSGQVYDVFCDKCEGNGRIFVTERDPKLQRGARIVAWIAVIILCGLAAYLIGHGGK
jgi:hypothetical protein